jgi:hypothetical protein
MDHIDNILATNANSSQLSLPICATLVIARIPSIGITTRQIAWKFIGLLWVSMITFLFSALIYVLLDSSSPVAQACLLQESRVGRRLDQDGSQSGSRGV